MQHVILLSIFILMLIMFNIVIFIICIFILMINQYLNILISFIIINCIIVDIFYASSTLLIDDLIFASHKYDIFMLINESEPHNYHNQTSDVNNLLVSHVMSQLIQIIVIFILLEIQPQSSFYLINLISYNLVGFEYVIYIKKYFYFLN